MNQCASFPATSNTLETKNNVKNAATSTALTLVSLQSHNEGTANHYLRSSGGRNGAQRRTKVSFGRTSIGAAVDD